MYIYVLFNFAFPREFYEGTISTVVHGISYICIFRSFRVLTSDHYSKGQRREEWESVKCGL